MAIRQTLIGMSVAILALGCKSGDHERGEGEKPAETKPPGAMTPRELIGGLASPDAQIRAATIQELANRHGMGKLTNDVKAAASQKIVDALRDPDAEVRTMAVTFVGFFMGKAAVKPLIAVIEDAKFFEPLSPRDQERLKSAVVMALGMHGDSSAIPTLQRLSKDPDLKSRAEAAIEEINMYRE